MDVKMIKCVICGSKKNFIIHHKIGPLVRNTFDETIIFCRRCHISVHDGFIDREITELESRPPTAIEQAMERAKGINVSADQMLEIENTGYFIDLVKKPRKCFLTYRQKKKKEEIAFYWAIYNYGTLASIYTWRDIKQSVIRL